MDIRATSRLNRLYVALLRDNPEWGATDRRHDMSHFMARLIFCFFAEDTEIFQSTGLFTRTVEQMSERDSSNTHDVIGTLFRAMNTEPADRAAAIIPRWADAFPHVNGGLFSGNMDVPRFNKIARSYLVHIGSLDWLAPDYESFVPVNGGEGGIAALRASSPLRHRPGHRPHGGNQFHNDWRRGWDCRPAGDSPSQLVPRVASDDESFVPVNGGEGGIRTHVPELPDHPISSRRRYDHFGTSPINLCSCVL